MPLYFCGLLLCSLKIFFIVFTDTNFNKQKDGDGDRCMIRTKLPGFLAEPLCLKFDRQLFVFKNF